jgi:type IV secretory pathway TraG/TraD family ATPase VirD4
VQGASGEAYQALSSLANLPSQTRQSVVTTALGAIDAYQGHLLAEANQSLYDDFRLPEMISTGKGTLFIVSPLDQANTGPIICALLDYLYLNVRRTSENNQDHGLPNPSLWLLDELANLSPLRALPQMLSTVRSYNLTLSCIIQDPSQLEHIYGKPLTQTIMQNCTTILFSGQQNVEMLKRIQELAGQKWVRPPGGSGRTQVPKITISELSNFGRGKVRIISPSENYKKSAAFYKNLALVSGKMKGKQ